MVTSGAMFFLIPVAIQAVIAPISIEASSFGESTPTHAVHVVDNELAAPPDHTNDSRIYNGEVSNTRYPFMVAIMIVQNNGNTFFCGGSVVSDLWVLTAAHCLYDNGNYGELALAIRAGKAEAWVAAYDISVAEASSVTQKIPIQSTWETVPAWNRQTQVHDIALLKLSRTIQFNGNFGTICIGQRNYDNYNNVNLLGWGLHNCFNNANKLNEAVGYTITNTQCRRSYSLIVSTMICAGITGYQGGYAEQSPGDSGGPLWYMNPSGRYVQIGVVSFNRRISDTNKCPNREAPGVYTRTSQYINFMRNTMRQAGTNSKISVCD